MCIVSSFQVTQKDPESGVSTTEEKLSCTEQNASCDGTGTRKLRASHIQGKDNRDGGLCRRGNGRIWPFIQQRAARERESFDVLTEKMDCRTTVADRETRSGKRDHEGLLLFKEEEETPCRDVLPLQPGQQAEAEENSPCIHEEATRQARLTPKLCQVPSYMRKSTCCHQ